MGSIELDCWFTCWCYLWRINQMMLLGEVACLITTSLNIVVIQSNPIWNFSICLVDLIAGFVSKTQFKQLFVLCHSGALFPKVGYRFCGPLFRIFHNEGGLFRMCFQSPSLTFDKHYLPNELLFVMISISRLAALMHMQAEWLAIKVRYTTSNGIHLTIM